MDADTCLQVTHVRSRVGSSDSPGRRRARCISPKLMVLSGVSAISQMPFQTGTAEGEGPFTNIDHRGDPDGSSECPAHPVGIVEAVRSLTRSTHPFGCGTSIRHCDCVSSSRSSSAA